MFYLAVVTKLDDRADGLVLLWRFCHVKFVVFTAEERAGHIEGEPARAMECESSIEGDVSVSLCILVPKPGGGTRIARLNKIPQGMDGYWLAMRRDCTSAASA